MRVLAYILNLGEVVPADFTLSDRNIAATERRLPNRNGKVFFRDLWEVGGKGDVANTACMRDCPVDGRLAAALPDAARTRTATSPSRRGRSGRRAAPTRGTAGNRAGSRTSAGCFGCRCGGDIRRGDVDRHRQLAAVDGGAAGRSAAGERLHRLPRDEQPAVRTGIPGGRGASGVPTRSTPSPAASAAAARASGVRSRCPVRPG